MTLMNLKKKELAIVILAAGKSTRMKSKKSKLLHHIAGRPAIHYLLDTINEVGASTVIAVTGENMDQLKLEIASKLPSIELVTQKEQLGTANAAQQALPLLLSKQAENILVINADTPLIPPAAINKMLITMTASNPYDVCLLAFTPENNTGYGKLVLDKEGNLEKIVEEKDATQQEKKIRLCNSGIFMFNGHYFEEILKRIDNKNVQKEYYITDAIQIAKRMGLNVGYVEHDDANELLGINSRSELAYTEEVLQDKLRAKAMANGVTFVDPKSVFLHYDTIFGQDVVIYPFVVFGPKVVVGDDVEIKSFSHIEGTKIATRAVIGPFARLRGSSYIGSKAKIGNFVEIKNSHLNEDVKVSHLSYIGDTEIGEETNIGAGTITCNYDGFSKHKTIIGSHCSIGSNSSLIAPVKIADSAIIGAGSVINKDVPPDSIAISRATQENLVGKAPSYRKRRMNKEE